MDQNPPEPIPSGPSERNLKLWACALAFFAAAYFSGGASSNQNARLNAIFAFAEPGTPDTGTFRIDRFMVSSKKSINTLDWAVHDGHYYANKAPGTLWLGAAIYTVLVQLELLLGISFDDPYVVLANVYWINLFVSVLPFVLATASMFELSRALGASPARAASVAIASGLGTLFFPYSTQLWGHTTAAAFIAMALAQVYRGTARGMVLAGACAGMAVCTDYLAIISALAIGVLVLIKAPWRTWQFALGALPLALALMTYHTLCFGGPLVTAAQMSNPAFLEQERALGMFGSLSGEALWSLTFGLTRGLFTQCPILLAAIAGFYFWIKRAPREPLPYVCLVTSLLYIVANASFNGWHGGATVGARYLICALPTLAIGLHALPVTPRVERVAYALFALSAVNMLAIAAVNPLAPDEHKNPLYGYTYAMLLEGKVSPYPFKIKLLSLHPQWPAISEHAMWNAGELLGLQGLPSLLPLLLGVAAVTVLGLKRRRHIPSS
jgi:hypothetical protein